MYAINSASKAMPLVHSIINKDDYAFDFMLNKIAEDDDIEDYVIGLAAFCCILIHSLAEVTDDDAIDVFTDWALQLAEQASNGE